MPIWRTQSCNFLAKHCQSLLNTSTVPKELMMYASHIHAACRYLKNWIPHVLRSVGIRHLRQGIYDIGNSRLRTCCCAYCRELILSLRNTAAFWQMAMVSNSYAANGGEIIARRQVTPETNFYPHPLHCVVRLQSASFSAEITGLSSFEHRCYLASPLHQTTHRKLHCSFP